MADSGGSGPSTTRLVDYFAVIGYDDAKERAGASVGKVVQRFPAVDWLDVPFFNGLELFCQPQGWRVSTKPQAPTFFISVLTDIGADRHYVACLSFSEARYGSENLALNDEDDIDIDAPTDLTSPSSTTLHQSSTSGKSQIPLVYCPKCLVLVSRHPYFEAFRNCLSIIYSVFMDKLPVELEQVVGNLVSAVQVNPPGGPMVKFSLGASDRQAIQPPQTSTIPMTQSTVAVLFQQLGINNVITLFSAVLTDKKILFQSQSYTRLMDACHALSSLIYPFKYRYPYIPLVPGSLLDVLQSPTPFIMGLHMAYKRDLAEIAMEVICVDFDNGSVSVPDAMTVPPLPEPYQTRLQTCLALVLNKELFTADFAFGMNFNNNGSNKPFALTSSMPINVVDKQIRACFLRLFADIFADYRSCLKIIRIYPKAFLTFHKAAFLGMRGFQDEDFMNRLIDSMAFHEFVMERGVPYRVCDLFDDVYATMQKTIHDENDDREKMFDNIQQLAQQFLNNETTSQTMVNKVPSPSDWSNPASANSPSINTRVAPPFPSLDPNRIQAIIDENVTKLRQQQPTTGSPTSPNGSTTMTTTTSWNRTVQPREVPGTPKTAKLYLLKNPQQINGSTRRLDVLKACLKFIFENKISDARKNLSAVQLSMKNNVVRVAFCQELFGYLHMKNQATVDGQQFDLLVRLMNCALQNDSAADEYGVAYALLSLAPAFCRKLSTGVLQFAYTCIQDHTVWQNQQFWEAAFYHDVHLQLRDLYGAPEDRKTSAPIGMMPSRDAWNLHEEPSALKIAAEKLRALSRMTSAEAQEYAKQEEAIIYSQAIHYANRIVYFRVPMDANKLQRVNIRSLEESSNVSASASNVSHVENASRDGDSTTESEAESGYADGGADVARSGDLGQNITRWILKFLDKTCSEAGLPTDRLNRLNQMVGGVVAMHIETIENVYKESKKLPPIHKPKMLVPEFLPNEQMLQGYLRVYLLPDGRQDSVKSLEKAHDNCLLPAEGAIFMTNYRLIFKGQPCDPYVCEKVVMRVIPLMSVTKHKRIGQQYLMGADQTTHYFPDALQIRSASFQLMKIAFDEEVGQDKVHTFCQTLEQWRWPETLDDIFAMSATNSFPSMVANTLAQQKVKHGTLKGFAKKTFLKTAQKAGFGKSSTTKTTTIVKTELTFSTAHGSPASTPFGPRSGAHHLSSNSTTLPSPNRRAGTGGSANAAGSDSDSERVSERTESKAPFTRTLDRLSERSYCKDYQRLGLCTRVEVTLHSGNQAQSGGSSNVGINLNRSHEGQFRLTVVNRMYNVCKTYPAVVVVPAKISDDSIKKIAKGHKHSRFPVVTWCSERGALLLRGAGFQMRSWNRWKQQATGTNLNTPGNVHQRQLSQQAVLKSSVEQERYFAGMVALSPGLPLHLSAGGHGLSSSMGSLLSLDSLLLANIDAMSMTSSYSNTPDIGRKPLSLAGSVASGGAGGQLQKLAALRNSGGKTMAAKFSLRPGQSSAKTSTLQNAPRTPASISSSAPRRVSVISDTAHYRMGASQMSSPASQTLQRASLYIFGEKSQAKVFKLDPKCEFIPVDFPQAHDAKESLKKFLRVAAPSSSPNSDSSSYSFLKALDESGWLQLVRSLLQISGAIVDIIDLQNSSVCVCLEYGWDATTQIVSLAQLMLDPYYRTLEGFRTLVEKEWLSFGHRFSHRCNHTLESSTSGFAPIFLLFLDAVQQIQHQYPGAFEFNDFYLRFLAYHSSAAYFRTFLLDSEAERVASGLLQFDSKPRPRPEIASSYHHYHQEETSSSAATSSTNHPQTSATSIPGIKARGAMGRHGSTTSAIGGGGNGGSASSCASVWDYINERHQRSTRFYNFLYTPGKYTVLRPQFGLASLNLWDFFTDDPLSFGSAYDLEAAEAELQDRETDRSDATSPLMESQQQQGVAGGTQSTPPPSRKLVDLKYDSVEYAENNIFESILEQIHNRERDSDVLPQKWTAVLNKLRQRMERDEEESAQIGAAAEWAHWLSRTLHKKATIELLLRGRMISRGGGGGGGMGGGGAAGATTGYGGSGTGAGAYGGSGQLRGERLSIMESGNGGHSFQKYNPTAPEHCHVCNGILWSVVRQGLRCSSCDFSCHEKCAPMVQTTCIGASIARTGLTPQSSSAMMADGSRLSDGSEYAGSTKNASSAYDDSMAFERFASTPQAETRTYEGYLMKRGALLKAWKQRFFVLDSIKNELRYFDTKESTECRGHIDLGEVTGIGPAPPPAGTPKNLEGCFFDLKTIRRVYNFMANNQSDAHVWIEKIQACL